MAIDFNGIASGSDIVSLIGKFTNLKYEGRRLKGLCPLHEEKTASFFVDPYNKRFKCFGCGKYGNAINFIGYKLGLSPAEAATYVVEACGMSSDLIGTGKPDAEKEALYTVMNNVVSLSVRELQESKIYFEAAARFGGEQIEDFRIGYCPRNKSEAFADMLNKRFGAEKIESLGLLAKGKYFVLSGRFIFPVSDMNGRICGLGGQAFDRGTENLPKYINSRESPIFNKSSCLFGYNVARETVMHDRKVVLVEGYRDVIAMHAAGHKNTVGIMSSSLSPFCGKVLCGKVRKIIYVPDTDEPGITGMKRSLLRSVFPFLRAETDIDIVILKGGKDAAEVWEKSPVSLSKELRHSVSIQQYVCDEIIRKSGGELTFDNMPTALHAVEKTFAPIKQDRLRDRLIAVSQDILRCKYFALLAGKLSKVR